METNFRVTFHDGPTGNKRKNVDVYAENSREAFSKAYKLMGSEVQFYTDAITSEIPREPSVIGVEFEYTDTYFKRNFTGRVFIKAENEAQAVKYYEKHYMGKRFNHDNAKTEEDGKCIRGKVKGTYFACGLIPHADATEKPKENTSLESKISDAELKERKPSQQHLVSEKDFER